MAALLTCFSVWPPWFPKEFCSLPPRCTQSETPPTVTTGPVLELTKDPGVHPALGSSAPLHLWSQCTPGNALGFITIFPKSNNYYPNTLLMLHFVSFWQHYAGSDFNVGWIWKSEHLMYSHRAFCQQDQQLWNLFSFQSKSQVNKNSAILYGLTLK